METTWLVNMYEGAGLEPDDAKRAAEETKRRLLARASAGRGSPKNARLSAMRVRDPLVSVNRILGRTTAPIPFFDEVTGRLSLVAFTQLLKDLGTDPVVALAYAKVVVEAYEPAELYGPIWIALGQRGPVDMDALRALDWSILRSGARRAPVTNAHPEHRSARGGSTHSRVQKAPEASPSRGAAHASAPRRGEDEDLRKSLNSSKPARPPVSPRLDKRPRPNPAGRPKKP